MPVISGTNDETVGHLLHEYYTTIKNNEKLLFKAKWSQLENIMLSEGSQFQKDRYRMFSLI